MKRFLLVLAVTALGISLLASPSLAGGGKDVSRPVVRGEKNMKFPTFSPDGSRIAFSLHGDLWTVPAEGGYARRITVSAHYDTKPRWSPDGKRIAFSSKRSGNWDIWITRVDRGKPRRITFDSAFDSPCCWSADGAWVYFHSSRTGKMNIFKMKVDGGFAVQLTEISGRDLALAPDGQTLVYAWGGADYTRKAYIGSSNWDLYVQEGPDTLPRRLTSYEGNDRKPFFVPGIPGEVFYRSEKDGHYNIYRIPLAGGDPQAVTEHESDVDNARASTDGRHLVYEMDFHLWRLDLTTGKSAPVAVTINADLKGPAVVERTLTDGARNPGWSPDGRTLAFQLRGDLWVMDASGGKARRLTHGASRDEWPKFSPDGRRIAFFSDRSGNKDLWIMDARGGKAQQVTFDKHDDFYHGWHPDGNRLVFCSTRSGNKDIWTVDLRTGERRQLTKDRKNDDDPVFSPDGGFVAFDSGRTGSQNIYILPAGGGKPRRLTAGRFDQIPSWSPDGTFLAFERSEGDGGPAIWVVSKDGGPAMQVAASGSMPRWSPRGDLIAFEHSVRDKSMIYTVEAPAKLVTGKPVNFTAQVEVDLVQERVQAFDEAWKYIKDSFYDPKLHGVDWNAVKKRYRPVAETTRTTEEINSLIDRMLGELKASHMGIWGGSYTKVHHPAPSTGYLGWKIEKNAGGSFQVDSVLPGGPADKVWIREGDFVFEVGGKKLDASTNLSRLLAGTAGKPVPVRVGPTPSREDSRIVKINPTSWGGIRGLQYKRWLEKRRDAVEEAKGKLGYIHLRMMGDRDLEQFKKAVAGRLKNTEGMILDVRNNGGGHIHQDLLDILTRKPFGAYHPRGGKKTYQPALYYTRPVVVLINERSFSDAEVFPQGFKALKRGPVIGVPTNGGVIGTGSTTLINGATLRLPRVGWFTLDGKNLEGLGVKPDILVEETPEDRLHDRDPQLRKAIRVLQDLIEKEKEAERGDEDEEKIEPGGKTESSEEEGF